MFSPRSRYAGAGTCTVRSARGRTEIAIRLPMRPRPPVRGFHQRHDGQRADHIAFRHLGDATAFWRLCDAGGALVPDTLGARDLIAVPFKA